MNMLINILLLPLGHIPNSLPFALESIILSTSKHLKPMAFWCYYHASHVVNSIKKIWHVQVHLYLHVFASIRITYSLMSWLCIYLVSWWDLNFSARINVTTITKMELHSTRILGNSPSSIKNSLTQNTLLICCQHNNILSLCCSIHHNTFWNSFKTSMELSSSLSYHLLFNTYRTIPVV